MWWKENFRVSRETFNFICANVGPVIQRQDAILRAAIPLEKRAAVGLWRLATGDSYRSCGLMFTYTHMISLNRDIVDFRAHEAKSSTEVTFSSASKISFTTR